MRPVGHVHMQVHMHLSRSESGRAQSDRPADEAFEGGSLLRGLNRHADGAAPRPDACRVLERELQKLGVHSIGGCEGGWS